MELDLKGKTAIISGGIGPNCGLVGVGGDT